MPDDIAAQESARRLEVELAAKERDALDALEGQNLGDARVYDVFGVQKPGRAFYFKLTAELR